MMPPIDPPTDDTILTVPGTDTSFDPASHDPDYPGIEPIFVNNDSSIDPQEDISHEDDSFIGDPTYPGGVFDVLASGISPTAPWEVPGWLYTNDPGFYVHEGNVYISGRAEAYSGGSYMGSATIFTGIPPEYAPNSTVSSRVLIDHTYITYEYAADGPLKMGPWLPVTITPEGDVILDGGNPVRTPPGSADFTSFAIILSSLTWPTGDQQVYDAYGPTGYLDEWVATAAKVNTEYGNVIPADIWMNVDGSYTAHDERMHLNGNVELLGDYAAYPYDALIGIPANWGARQSSEGSLSDWCFVPQKDGYLFMIAMQYGGYHRALYSQDGAQNPSAVGNLGCGFFDSYFYERISDGSLTRGKDATLDFVPATVDTGVSYQGAKGAPVGDLNSNATWRGNLYSVNLQFTPNQLINTPKPTTVPMDYTVIQGAGQLAFIFGLHPAMASGESYYKVVYTYDATTGNVWTHLILEQCGSNNRGLLGSFTWHPSSVSVPINAGFLLEISPNAGDVGYTGTTYPGYNYWEWTPYSGTFRGSDYVATPLAGSAPPAGHPKGDMGFHLPGTSKIVLADISGVGSWPLWTMGDMVDFTNCGWPLI